MRDIGKNIRDLRQTKNMTQDTLAERLFVTRQTVSNYETGRTRPDVDMVVRIAEVLETDANTILYGIPAPPERKVDIRKLLIALCVLALLFPLYLYAQARAYYYKFNLYLIWPNLLLEIFAKPVPYTLLGWTMMQALGTFTKLAPVENRYIRRILYVLGIFYLAVMLPFTVSIFTDFSLPSFWSYMVFGLLGALPGSSFQPEPSLIHFLLGILFWCFPLPQKNKETV